MTKLDELVQVISGRQVYIQTHNYPDQDALASAWGLQRLLQYRGIEATICYEGIFDKVNTIELAERCRIPAYNVAELIMDETAEIILVDGQYGNTNMNDLAGREIACIDHHKNQHACQYRFEDIRSAGSCATIIAEYFQENDLPVDQKLAAALLYGLKVDTANMSRGVTDADVDMFVYLYRRADVGMLAALDGYMLTVRDLEAYQKAIRSLMITGSFGMANVGKECSEAMIGTLSDFIISLAEVEFSMVFSYRAGGLKISVRSARDEWDADRIIRKALGGCGGGGGHAAMAAGFIGNLTEEEAMQHAERVGQSIRRILEV